MQKKRLRIATRKSPLALWQANHIRQQLLKLWPDLEITLLPMVTSGDRFLKDKLQSLGGKGLFVKELENALIAEEADIAVHSMKDVPTTLPPGLSISVICQRDNPLDAFVSFQHQHLDDLPHGSLIGTTSLRRQSQLLATRPDLTIKPLRGNIQTRLEKLQRGEYDAIILACAGLERMGLATGTPLPTNIMLPACGQGALGIESREHDEETNAIIAPLNHAQTHLCVQSERFVNARLGGNCHVPLAVYCDFLNEQTILIRARVLNESGQTCIQTETSGHVSLTLELAEQCTQQLIHQGALELLS